MQGILREDSLGIPHGVKVPTVTNDERRARLVARHRLGPDQRAATMAQIADALVGLHATEPTTPYISAWARAPGISREDIDSALYEERNVVRILGMRRTMFVVSLETAPLLDRGCSRPLAEKQRQTTAKMMRDADVVPDPDEWLDRVSAATLEALRHRGEAVATELTEDVPELATKIPYRPDKKWGGEIGVSTRVLFELAAEGKIVRGRPRGSWLSSQYRWSTMDQWVDLPDPDLSEDQIRAELIRRYLDRFGPATETDVVWWTGWTKTQAREALRAVEAVEVGVEDGATGYVLDDFEPAPLEAPSVALLPGLDSTVMGWKEREWYLGGHDAILFDRNGNAGPTVWVDGRVVGGWGQLASGEVVWRLLEDVGRDHEAAIESRAAELEKWLDGTVIAWRFPAPLQKELAGPSTVEP